MRMVFAIVEVTITVLLFIMSVWAATLVGVIILTLGVMWREWYAANRKTRTLTERLEGFGYLILRPNTARVMRLNDLIRMQGDMYKTMFPYRHWWLPEGRSRSLDVYLGLQERIDEGTKKDER